MLIILFSTDAEKRSSQSLINQGNILTIEEENIDIASYQVSQSLINQGNILTENKKTRKTKAGKICRNPL